MGQGLLKGELAMHLGTGDHLAGGLVAAAAVEGLGFDVGNLFDGRRGGDQLEDGAGHVGGVEKPFDIDAVVGGIVLIYVGHVVPPRQVRRRHYDAALGVKRPPAADAN